MPGATVRPGPVRPPAGPSHPVLGAHPQPVRARGRHERRVASRRGAAVGREPTGNLRDVGARVGAASYSAIRRFLLLAGLAVLAALVVAMVARGVDTVEVIAAALYVGVFLGGLLAGVIGGATAGLAAAAVYAILRVDAIEALGPSRYGGLLVARLVGYVLFGLLVGAAWQWIGERLDKLDAFDDVDDETLLLNARGLVQVIDRETSRARRHGSTFAVVTIDVPMDVFDRLSRAAGEPRCGSSGGSSHRAPATSTPPGSTGRTGPVASPWCCPRPVVTARRWWWHGSSSASGRGSSPARSRCHGACGRWATPSPTTPSRSGRSAPTSSPSTSTGHAEPHALHPSR